MVRRGGLLATVVTPGTDGAVAVQSDAVKIPRRNGPHSGQAAGLIQLAEEIAPVGLHRPVGEQHDAVVATEGDVTDTGQVRRRITGQSPQRQRSVGAHRRRDLATRRDGDGVRQVGRRVGHAILILAPGDDRPITQQRHAVIRAGGDCGDIREAGRDVRLAVIVETPRDHGAIRPQGQRVLKPRADGGDVAQTGWQIRLTRIVRPPRHHGGGVRLEMADGEGEAGRVVDSTDVHIDGDEVGAAVPIGEREQHIAQRLSGSFAQILVRQRPGQRLHPRRSRVRVQRHRQGFAVAAAGGDGADDHVADADRTAQRERRRQRDHAVRVEAQDVFRRLSAAHNVREQKTSRKIRRVRVGNRAILAGIHEHRRAVLKVGVSRAGPGEHDRLIVHERQGQRHDGVVRPRAACAREASVTDADGEGHVRRAVIRDEGEEIGLADQEVVDGCRRSPDPGDGIGAVGDDAGKRQDGGGESAEGEFQRDEQLVRPDIRIRHGEGRDDEVGVLGDPKVGRRRNRGRIVHAGDAERHIGRGQSSSGIHQQHDDRAVGGDRCRG